VDAAVLNVLQPCTQPACWLLTREVGSWEMPLQAAPLVWTIVRSARPNRSVCTVPASASL